MRVSLRVGGKRTDNHVGELLGSYLDGQLSTREMARVEAHLLSCAQCRQELEQMRRLLALLRLCPPARPKRNFALVPEAASRVERRRLLFTPVAAAVAVLVLCLSIYAEVRLSRVAEPPGLSLPGVSLVPPIASVALQEAPSAAVAGAPIEATGQPTPAPRGQPQALLGPPAAPEAAGVRPGDGREEGGTSLAVTPAVGQGRPTARPFGFRTGEIWRPLLRSIQLLSGGVFVGLVVYWALRVRRERYSP
jgi:hypothetical protein